MHQLTYRSAIKNAASLKTIGMNEIHLDQDDKEKPWQHVIEVRPGGSHRLDMDTTVWFTAQDPKTKLRFCWSFEIEDDTANGKGFYEINAASCKVVLAKLPAEAKIKLAAYFKSRAVKVREKGKEWQGYADRQKRDSETLELLGACA